MPQNNSDTISRRILKAMTLFGGVRVVSILCSIIRTKFVALWLGPAGVGLFGLYNNVVDMISSFSNLGMRDSCVRNIASEKSSYAIAVIITVVRRWAMMLGALGSLIALILSPILSFATFGDYEHIRGFVALSVVFLINSLTLGEEAVLQGTARLRRLARASICGVVAGMLVSIPMFYFWRLDSVIPSIIAYHATTGLFMWIWRNKDFKSEPVSLTRRETVTRGLGFIKVGTYMMVSSFVSLLCAYLFRSYLNNYYGTTDVGLFQAGFTLVSQYTGIIFAAMGVEYYPRLSKTIDSRKRTSLFVSTQINLLLTLLIPIIAVFIFASQWIVLLLYSSEFTSIEPYITVAMLGIVFRALSWGMAFTILAKGDGPTFIVTECVSAAVGLALKVLLFGTMGIAGLGVAFTAWYLVYVAIIYYVYRRRYRLTLHTSTFKLAIIAIASTAATLFCHNREWLAAEVILIILLAAISLTILRKTASKTRKN